MPRFAHQKSSWRTRATKSFLSDRRIPTAEGRHLHNERTRRSSVLGELVGDKAGSTAGQLCLWCLRPRFWDLSSLRRSCQGGGERVVEFGFISGVKPYKLSCLEDGVSPATCRSGTILGVMSLRCHSSQDVYGAVRDRMARQPCRPCFTSASR